MNDRLKSLSVHCLNVIMSFCEFAHFDFVNVVMQFCNRVDVGEDGQSQRSSQREMDRDRLRIDAFISIVGHLLTAKIKFPRTKQQPLLPNQTLMQPNRFKTALIRFLGHFSVQLDAKSVSPTRLNRVYKNDKQRSNKISKLFLDALYEIKSKICSNPSRDCTSTHSTASTVDIDTTAIPPQTALNPLNPTNSANALPAAMAMFAVPLADGASSLTVNSLSNISNLSVNPPITAPITVAHPMTSNHKLPPNLSSLRPLSMNSLSNGQNVRVHQQNGLQSTDLSVNPLYSVTVPFGSGELIEYQFLSFNPLLLRQRRYGSEREPVAYTQPMAECSFAFQSTQNVIPSIPMSK